MSSGQQPPLRPALKLDDDGDKTAVPSSSSSVKAVQIAEPEPEPKEDEEYLPKKQFSAGLARRLSGRAPVPNFGPSRSSSISQGNLEAFNAFTSSQSPPALSEEPASQDGSSQAVPFPSHHSNKMESRSGRFLAQVADWLEHERLKSQNRKRRVPTSKKKSKSPPKEESPASERPPGLYRSYSIDSQSSDVSLDRLQRIIDDNMNALGLNSVPTYSPKVGRKSQRRRSVALHRTASSDTEWHDGDVVVPDCDGMLDNSKTLSYSGGKFSSDDQPSAANSKEDKERKAWLTFKSEIIRLAHTLRLKGWKRVPLEGGDLLTVERMSGALTNAVYAVSPPKDESALTGSSISKKKPAKLLLRIYGPNVDHIIDRENELMVLQRLARKQIGPRLLGTFKNGRFEQFLNATALTWEDMRNADTSKQIAKRMRELHDGIELLDNEQEDGPGVWKNWDNWLPRVERVVEFLDEKIISGNVGRIRGPDDAWKERGLVLGVQWAGFRAVVEKYRRVLNEKYGDPKIIRSQLVFAHNDTQYGNILRVRPDDEKSPLLQPNYEHKQLVVIDFEYAGGNTRGYEFANHFNEWTYNYHDEKASHVCNTRSYPKPDEQRRFLKAYIDHRPEYPHAGASTPSLTPLSTPTIGPTTPGLNPSTPGLNATNPSTSSIVDFMLDARVPPGGWREEEKRQEEQAEQQVNALIEETRLWRLANSAFWVAWGIMQAKIPGLDEPEDENSNADDQGFDYLGYAQERALFFWGDCVLLGLVNKDELPEAMRNKIKLVDY